jgi:TATA-box binding protein (TBP) (component of TFIID and TFIIIB)
MKVSGAKQNKDISKAIEYVKERLEVALTIYLL